VIELQGITWDHPRGLQPLAASEAVYASERSIRVSWRARSLKDFGDAPIDALAAQYDLLVIDHPHVGLAAKTGCLAALDGLLPGETLDRLAAGSAGPSHASYFYRGRQWALAVDTAMQASCRREDLVGPGWEPPGSFDDVAPAARRLRERGLWMAIPLAPTDAVCSFISLCAGLGEPAGHGERLVDKTTGTRALSLLAEWARLAHPECLTWNPIVMLDRMSAADELVYCPLTFCYTNYSRRGFRERPICFGTIPGVRGSILGGAGIAVSAHSEHRQAAAEYAAWISSAAIQRTLYVREGGQPGNIAAWRDEEANRITGGFFRDTLPTLEAAHVRPRYAEWPAFQEEAGNVIHAWLAAGGGDPAPCLARLDGLYRESLAREGADVVR